MVSRYRGLRPEYGGELGLDYFLMLGDRVECGKRGIDIKEDWPVSTARISIEKGVEPNDRPEVFQSPQVDTPLLIRHVFTRWQGSYKLIRTVKQ